MIDREVIDVWREENQYFSVVLVQEKETIVHPQNRLTKPLIRSPEPFILHNKLA